MRTRNRDGDPDREYIDDQVVERRRWMPGAGSALGLLGTAGIVVSLFLPWNDVTDAKPRNIPTSFLWDHLNTSGPSLLLVLIPVAAVLLIGSLLPGGTPARLLAGIVGIVAAGLFAYQIDQSGRDLGSALDVGWYSAAVGAVVGFVSGMVPTGFTSRRTVERHQASPVHDRDDRNVKDRDDDRDRDRDQVVDHDQRTDSANVSQSDRDARTTTR